MNKVDIESFYPLIFFGLIILVRFLLAKKSKKEAEKPSEIPQKVMPRPSAPAEVPQTFHEHSKIESLTEQSPEKEVKTPIHLPLDTYYLKQKKRSRIQKLVSRMESKRNLILLSEILKKPRGSDAIAHSQNRKTRS